MGRSCLDYIQNNLCFLHGFYTNAAIGRNIHCEEDCDIDYIIGDVGDDYYADYDLVKDFAVNGYDATSCPECGCRGESNDFLLVAISIFSHFTIGLSLKLRIRIFFGLN